MNTKEFIERIQGSGATPTAQALTIYGRLVSDAGLYGKAFFGHRATPAEKKQLKRYWARAIKLVGGVDGEGQREHPEANITNDLPGAEPLEGTAHGGVDGSESKG